MISVRIGSPGALARGRGRRERGRRAGGSAGSARRDGFADLLGQHEAHVLAHDVELRDVLDAARAEELDELGDEVLRRARARGDADHAPALEPLLVHFAGVVDQVRVGAAVARDLDQAHRVGRVARADHEHQVAARGHLLDGRLAVGGRVADVVGARTDDLREALAQARDDRASFRRRRASSA